MAKLNIDNDYLAESFFDECRILGIVSPLSDYQLIWNANRMMGFKFRLNHNLEIQLVRKQRDYFFSVYEYCLPNSSLVYYVYNNQYDGEYLLPEFRHLDFLWLTKDEEVSDGDFAYLGNRIKRINGVQLVTELQAEKIKNKQHLIF